MRYKYIHVVHMSIQPIVTAARATEPPLTQKEGAALRALRKERAALLLLCSVPSFPRP
jgi:hypothetical protein